MGAVDSLIGAGLGLIMGNTADKRQLEQQGKLNQMQQTSNEEIAEYNQGLALETWDKTNYPAQVQQMRKAGLNPGLMYGGAGAGGGTAIQGNASGVSGAQAPAGSGSEWAQGAQLGIQGALLESQKNNIDADTRKKTVEADKTEGVDTEQTKATTGLINEQLKKTVEDTKNAEIQGEIMQYQKGITEVQKNIATETQDTIITKIGKELDYLGETITAQRTANKISGRTADNLIQKAAQDNIEQQIRMTGMKANIINTETNTQVQKKEIDNVVQATMNLVAQYSATKQGQEREWQKMSQKDKEIAISKQLADFGTNEAAHVKQWTGIITDVIETFSLGKYLNKSTPRPATPQGVRDSKGRTQPKGWTDELK